MIDFKKNYNLNEENLQFIKDLQDIEKGQTSAALIYKDSLTFDIEVIDGKVVAFFDDENCFSFDTMDEMILNLKIDGKPFIDVINDIDYNE